MKATPHTQTLICCGHYRCKRPLTAIYLTTTVVAPCYPSFARGHQVSLPQRPHLFSVQPTNLSRLDTPVGSVSVGSVVTPRYPRGLQDQETVIAPCSKHDLRVLCSWTTAEHLIFFFSTLCMIFFYFYNDI